MTSILVTGGLGFIGSHSTTLLLERGYDVTIIDNLCNSSKGTEQRIRDASGNKGNLEVHHGDIRSTEDLEKIFRNKEISDVIHFAGLKSVSESCRDPLEYWDVNVNGTVTLMRVMEECGCYNLVFSSSATVYGSTTELPISEESHIAPINPYGRTKLASEQLMQDAVAGNKSWKIAALRYFNPVGSHPSGLIGENLRNAPGNLFPVILRVINGSQGELMIYGDDWPTHDGTAIRDFVHVMDLADAHTAALDYLWCNSGGFSIFNLGTGQGYSVAEVIATFERLSNTTMRKKVVGRREGDAAASVSDPSQAKEYMKWSASRCLDDMVRDALKWANNDSLSRG